MKNFDPNISHVFTDSRKNFSDESIFIALVGENYDAAKFVPDLLARGLGLAVVTETKTNRTLLKDCDQDKVLFVEDSTQYLQSLAIQKLKFWRSLNTKNKVVALTGSNGKTTTKEMLAWLLTSYPAKVHVTKGNLNNHLGVPFTILEMDLESEILVLEMGTNHPGEIELLCRIGDPDIGLITNIGQSHLEFFHNEDNVFVEKSALYQHITSKPSGFFLLNCNDARLKKLKNKPKTHSFGFDQENEVVFNLSPNGFSLKSTKINIEITCPNIPERHNRLNMGMALALCALVWPDKKFKEKLIQKVKTYKAPNNNRSVIYSNSRIDIYLDAYNANPSSLSASIDGFIEWWSQKSTHGLDEAWFILGDMNELGERAPEYHHQIGTKLKNSGVKHAFFIGRFAKHYAAGFGGGEIWSNRQEFLLKYGQAPGTWSCSGAFIKGSRTLQLEELVDITFFPEL